MREKAIQRLTEYGFRPSLQRIAIVEYLFTHSTHPVVDTIFNELSSSIPTLSKTTVYNTLKLFEEKNIVPKRTGGKFYLRIEDTDGKRTVENGINGIIKDLKDIS